MRLARLTVAATLLSAGCSSSGGPSGSSAPPASTRPAQQSSTVPACPEAGSGQAWPKQAPDGLPVPLGLRIVRVQTSPNTVIRFTVPDDFHATVKYLLDALPKAGFVLGTGDSEAEEADIPFSHGSARGSIKVNVGDTCLTNGLLAVGVAD